MTDRVRIRTAGELALGGERGSVHVDLGDCWPARHHLVRSVMALEEDRDAGGARSRQAGISPFRQIFTLVTGRYWLMLCLADLGGFDEGFTQAATPLKDVQSTQQPHLIMRTHLAAGNLYAARGDGDLAVPHLETAMPETPRRTSPFFPKTTSLRLRSRPGPASA